MMRATKLLKMSWSIFSSAWDGGKATNLLTLMVALTLAMISPALAANGSNFILGNASNAATAVSRLTANIAGPTLQLWNTKTGPGATGLSLVTSYSSPPHDRQLFGKGYQPQLRQARWPGL